jgi:hypothetical protein
MLRRSLEIPPTATPRAPSTDAPRDSSVAAGEEGEGRGASRTARPDPPTSHTGAGDEGRVGAEEEGRAALELPPCLPLW